MSGDYHWSVALRRAIKRNRRDAHNRYLQLATVRPDGTPAVRSLVFRELCEEAMELRMVTDRRSAKVDEIASNAAAEIAWYFTHSREQFRFGGALRLVGTDAPDQSARLALWESLSEKAQEQFYWPHPGRPLGDGEHGVAASTQEPPDNFLMLALVRSVDHLTLRGDPQSRVLSRIDPAGHWMSQAVNP